MGSSSYGSYTWKKSWEEAMGVGVNVGLEYAWEKAANYLNTSTSSDKLHISTSHEAQWLSIKVLAFVRPYFEGAEPKRKMAAERNTSGFRLLSVQNGCLLQISSAGCLNSSHLKVSFNFLRWGGGRSSYKMSF